MRILALFLALLLSVPAQADTFDEVTRLVEEHFFDPNLRGVDWPALKAEQRRRLRGGEPEADVINDLLDHLGTSHTRYYPEGTPEYHQLRAIFTRGQGPTYEGLGWVVDEEGFVRDVWDGFPADQAGVLTGDRVLSSRDGRLELERRPGETVRVTAKAVEIEPQSAYLEAQKNSVRIVERGGKKLGYIHIRNYASPLYHEHLTEELLEGRLSQVDGVVIDLRGGWGGASPDYLNLFNRQVPQLTAVNRQGEAQTWESQWRKPTVVLIDEGSRSGKEILAYGFRKFGLARLVGTRTAGAVVFGRLFNLEEGALYLAVADALIDGERLEGIGVEPDVHVENRFPYNAGEDAQLDAALDELFRIL